MGDFFDLRATHNPHRWILPITPEVSVGRADHTFMFGGVGLAAGVQALERTCGRPVIWATAQYLSYARTGKILDLDVWTPMQGRQITHARVIGHVGDAEILTVNAALGARPLAFEGQWAEPPRVPAAADCPVSEGRSDQASLHDRVEIRVASGRYRNDRLDGPSPDGRLSLWIRPRGHHPIDAPMLALIADYLPGGIGHAIGLPTYGTSLDNTIRFGAVEPTGWVLCDIRIELVQRGFAHGTLHMFSEGGRLMAIGSQSVIIRPQAAAEDS